MDDDLVSVVMAAHDHDDEYKEVNADNRRFDTVEFSTAVNADDVSHMTGKTANNFPSRASGVNATNPISLRVKPMLNVRVDNRIGTETPRRNGGRALASPPSPATASNRRLARFHRIRDRPRLWRHHRRRKQSRFRLLPISVADRLVRKKATGNP